MNSKKLRRDKSPAIVSLLCLLIMSGCGPQVPEGWEASDSYILTTDTVSIIYVHNSQGAKIATIRPLKNSMKSIHHPTLIGSGKETMLAFTSRLDSNSSQYFLYLTDPLGEELETFGYQPDAMDGSPVNMELVFTLKGTNPRWISVMNASSGSFRRLFSADTVESEAVGPLAFVASFCPVFSPDGEQVAFIHVGEYIDSSGSMPLPAERRDIAIINRDGTDYRLLTGHHSTHYFIDVASWKELCWSADGEFIYAFATYGNNFSRRFYAVRVSDGGVFVFEKEFLESYSYAVHSPTGDTLLLGTMPSYADLYLLSITSQSGSPSVGVEPTRITTSQVYAEPDWGPGN